MKIDNRRAQENEERAKRIAQQEQQKEHPRQNDTVEGAAMWGVRRK